MGLNMGNGDWVKRIAKNRIEEGLKFVMFSWDKEGTLLVTGTGDIKDDHWWEVFDEAATHTTLKTPHGATSVESPELSGR